VDHDEDTSCCARAEQHETLLIVRVIRIGKEDFLLKDNQSFIAWLKESGIKHHYLERRATPA